MLLYIECSFSRRLFHVSYLFIINFHTSSSFTFCYYVGGIDAVFILQAALVKPGSLMWCTTPPTTSWWEPRPWWRTASFSSTACLTGSGTRPTSPLLWDAKRVPSWYVFPYIVNYLWQALMLVCTSQQICVPNGSPFLMLSFCVTTEAAVAKTVPFI
jgi:hypothetical protein